MLPLKIFARYWRVVLLIVVPLVLIPLLFIDENCPHEDQECIDREKPAKFKCAYVIIVMAIFWVCEAMPLAVTSLLPVLFFPMLGVQDTTHVTPNYMKETNMMFIAGLLIALSIEYCNLHKRIALRVMTLIGSSTKRLLLGVMLTTMFLSMWISNTATTAMMLPIVLAVLEELREKPPAINPTFTEIENSPNNEPPSYEDEINEEFTISKKTPDLAESRLEIVPVSPDSDEELMHKDIKRMFLFATCYSSNLGGTGTIIGSGTNLILQGHIKEVDVSQGGKYTDLTFATWMGYNVPGMVINGFIAFVYLLLVFQIIPRWRKGKGVSVGDSNDVAKMLRRKYDALGPMNFHEIAILICFIAVVALWFFRDPRFIKGWGPLIEENLNSDPGDSTAAMIVIFFLFVIPKNLDFSSRPVVDTRGTLLDWKYAQSKIPWGLVLLMGGGFAISNASDESGLSEWIGDKMNGLESLPNAVTLIIVMVLTAAVTEVSSNAAVANVVLPILITLSKRHGLHPLYLTLPAAISCSFAFMLPVATPPNAIVFATGDLKIMDMVKTGVFLNLSCIAVVFCLHISYGNLIFDYDNYEYPDVPSRL